MNFDYAGYRELDLVPKLENHKGEVYIVVLKVGEKETPFYVGQTKRFLGRMDDYFWAEFKATTDFNVGMAIQYFYNHFRDRSDMKVVVRHKLVENPVAEETAILNQLKSAGRLLVNRLGYNYNAPTNEEALKQLHARCDAIISRIEQDETETVAPSPK